MIKKNNFFFQKFLKMSQKEEILLNCIKMQEKCSMSPGCATALEISLLARSFVELQTVHEKISSKGNGVHLYKTHEAMMSILDKICNK